MAELSIAIGELRNKVSLFIGYGRIYADLSDDKKAEVTDVIDSGMRQFYFPPPIGDKVPYEWSFLKRLATIDVSASVVDAPADFGGIVGDFGSIGVDQGNVRVNYRVAIVSEYKARTLTEASGYNPGLPKYMAVRAKVLDANAPPEYEFIFYPTPGETFSLTYRYVITPPKLDDDRMYPLGGMLHADTVLLSCLAVAERRIDEEKGVQWDQFMERLAASIEIDKRSAAVSGTEPWPEVGEGAGIGMTYDDIARQVGGLLQYGWSSDLWTHEQVNVIDSIIQGGYRRFLYNPAGHVWEHMRPTTEIVLWTALAATAGTTVSVLGGIVTANEGDEPFYASMEGVDITIASVDYEILEYISPSKVRISGPDVTEATYAMSAGNYALPADWSSIEGTLTYATDEAWNDIELVSENQIRIHRQVDSSTGAPNRAAVRVRPSDGITAVRHELLTVPVPDTDYTVSCRYNVIPPRLTKAAPLPIGGPVHAQTLLEACLAEAEIRVLGGQGQHSARFNEQLMSSLQHDMRGHGPRTLGIMTDPTTELRRGRHVHRNTNTVTYEGTSYP